MRFNHFIRLAARAYSPHENALEETMAHNAKATQTQNRTTQSAACAHGQQIIFARAHGITYTEYIIKLMPISEGRNARLFVLAAADHGSRFSLGDNTFDFHDVTTQRGAKIDTETILFFGGRAGARWKLVANRVQVPFRFNYKNDMYSTLYDTQVQITSWCRRALCCWHNRIAEETKSMLRIE